MKIRDGGRRLTVPRIDRLFFQNSFYILLFYLICGDLFSKALLGLIRSFVRIPYRLDALLIYALLALAVLYSYKYIIRSFPTKELGVFVFLWCCFLISFAVESGFNSMYASMAKDFLIGTAGFICFRCIKDWNKFLKWLGAMAFVITISLAIHLRIVGGLGRYSMYLGYLLLPGVIISANELIRKKSILFGANLIFGLVLQLSMGARGPILCALVFICVRVLIETGRSKYSFLIISTTVIVGFFLFKYFDTIVTALSVFTGTSNLSNRVIAKFQSEQFFNGGTRNIVQSNAIEMIGNHFLTGVGIGRDRIYMARLMGDSYNALGYYTHNPFLEIWLQFGVLIGSVLLFYLFRPIVRALFKKNVPNEIRDVVLIMVFSGVVPLLISDSYLTKPEFFFAVAICSAVSKMKFDVNEDT